MSSRAKRRNRNRRWQRRHRGRVRTSPQAYRALRTMPATGFTSSAHANAACRSRCAAGSTVGIATSATHFLLHDKNNVSDHPNHDPTQDRPFNCL
jgi:hypothetical protein